MTAADCPTPTEGCGCEPPFWGDEDSPTVCIAHGRFIPCRKDGEHRYTANPFWVKSVRDYQESPIADLTWEPAWEAK